MNDQLEFARSMVECDPPVNICSPKQRNGGKPIKYHNSLKPGLYRVTLLQRGMRDEAICAGFVVGRRQYGKRRISKRGVIRCAPVLRRHIHKYIHRAEFVCEI